MGLVIESAEGRAVGGKLSRCGRRTLKSSGPHSFWRAKAHGVVVWAGLICLLFAAVPTTAQEAPTTVDEVSIVAVDPKSEKAISEFVSTTSVKSGTGQMGRWDKEICVSIENLRPDAADMIRELIASNAREVGLLMGAPNCKPNIFILATDNAEMLLTAMFKKNSRAFLDDEWTIREGQGKLMEFIASDRPVRWWYVVKRVTRKGQPYRVGAAIEGRGRIGSTVRADFSHVVVVLDVSRIGKINFPALAGYVAMVSLVQTSPDAEFAGVPTILRLFSDRDAGLLPAEGMTDWDRAFLKALYKAPRDAKRITIQERDISRAMQEALAETECDAKQ